jgi:hypothetical protein
VLTRRALLAGAAATAACRPSRPPLQGEILSRAWMERGHRVREPLSAEPTSTDSADIVIVGGGMAGITAAWRLARAGYTGTVLRLDAADRAGGTAMSGEGPAGPYAMGAHYVTLPSPEARHVRTILHDVGVITGFDADGRPRYDPMAVCLAPQERLHLAGTWVEGLWPDAIATPDDEAQLASFEARCRELTTAVGADGKPAFAIPLAQASEDPAFRALAELSFADWLDREGYGSTLLRWALQYDCRDDFGTSLQDTSAWAGLHYHCARRPDPADPLATNVLTWPAGNGWLVDALSAKIPWPLVGGAVARGVQTGSDVRVAWEKDGELRETVAKHLILAVPTRVARRLLDRAGGDVGPTMPDFAPWRIALLHVSALPAGRGVSSAWDSVLWDSPSLGYVSSAHQSGKFAGPSVLTWYEPLSDVAPAAGREALAAASWESERDRVLADLVPAHPDLEGLLERLDVFHWGHGTARPTVGLHRPGVLGSLLADLPAGVSLAHTDLSGMSLFEEAAWHGVRAAEEALEALGTPSPSIR